ERVPPRHIAVATRNLKQGRKASHVSTSAKRDDISQLPLAASPTRLAPTCCPDQRLRPAVPARHNHKGPRSIAACSSVNARYSDLRHSPATSVQPAHQLLSQAAARSYFRRRRSRKVAPVPGECSSNLQIVP